MLLGPPLGLAAVLWKAVALYTGRPPGKVPPAVREPGAVDIGRTLGLLGRGCIIFVGGWGPCTSSSKLQ